MDIQRTKKPIGRRYTLLLLLTAAIIGGLLFYGQWRKDSVQHVKTAVISSQTVRETAVCSGTIQTSESTEVFCSTPCVAGDVSVSVGDRVKAGDLLITVDRSATLAVAVDAGLSENQAALISGIPEALTAPKDGVVSAVNVKQGDTLDTASPCAVISSGSGLEVAVAVRENMLSDLRVGQTVEISGVAFRKKMYTGTLTSIASSARTRMNGTASETVVDAVVSLAPEEIDESLLVGLTAKAEIITSQKEGVRLVPYECLAQNEEGGYYVYRVSGEEAIYTPIETGEEYAGGVELLSDLSDTEEIVRLPEQLSGERVRIQKETEG